ncbi:MAG: hypothetical protein II998_04180 [Clostridia bacterium]|nr:hypothetical protein [Clostridia bacterium]
MKKFMLLTIILSLITALCACSKSSSPSNDYNEESSTSSDIFTNSETGNNEEIKSDEEQNDDTNPSVDSYEKPNSKPNDTATSQQQTKPQQNTEPSKENQGSSSGEVIDSKPDTETSTVGSALLSSFKSIIKSNSSANTEEIASKLLESPVIKFSGSVMPVEEGYLSGFDNTEIKGFKEGTMFAPMIGSIAFVGYVFTTEDTQSAKTLVSTLKSAANLRWNICVEAEEMICENVGNKVFFVMCPKTFEE